MAIYHSKSGDLGKYYFKQNDIEYGPFQLEWMLPLIDGDTLIKISNSKWCPAKQHMDFSLYFKPVVENVNPYVNDKSNSQPINTPTEKKKSSIGVILIFLSIIVIVFAIFMYLKMQKEEQKKEQLAFLVNQKYIIDSISADNAMKQEMLVKQQDSINSVTNSRLDSLKRHGDQLMVIQKSDELIDILKNYYLDITNREFDANKYFVDPVLQFITVENTTAENINDLFLNNTDFTNETFEVNDSTFKFDREESNIYYFTYTVKYNCFRKKKNANQSCDTDVEVGFDENFKIRSYKELKYNNLSFD